MVHNIRFHKYYTHALLGVVIPHVTLDSWF